MTTQVHFTHMERTDALEQYAIEKLELAANDFLNRNDYHMQVWLVNEKSYNQKGAHKFKCEVSVRFPPKKEVFIEKFSEDMYDAINLVEDALTQVLREESKKELQSRKQ